MTTDYGSSSEENEVEEPSSPSAPPPLPTYVTGSSTSAGSSIDEGKGRVFPCEACGADLKFHIGARALKCENCGTEKEISLDDDVRPVEKDFAAMFARIAKGRIVKASKSDDLAEVRCDSCGAGVVFQGATTSSSCPFCGKPVQRGKVHDADDRIPVDGVMPFRIDKNSANQRLKDWIKSRWFLPNDFKKRGVEGNFSGIYVPYWTFDSLTFNSYVGERGEHYWVTVGSGKDRRRVRKTRWYPASGRFQRFFDDVLVCAANKMPQKLLLELEPWPLQSCVPFKPDYLSGIGAETYTISLPDGFSTARQRIRAAVEAETRHRIGGDEQRIHRLDTRHDAVTFKHLLLPVWLLGYTWKDKERQIVVNAATGEVQGERPWSWIKITILVLIIIGVAAAGIAIANRSQNNSGQHVAPSDAMSPYENPQYPPVGQPLDRNHVQPTRPR